MIRVDVLDSSPVYLCGLVQVLPRETIEIVGVHSQPEEQLTDCADIYLMDTCAVETLGPMASSYVSRAVSLHPVLMLTPTHASPVQDYLDVGACGSVSKQDHPHVLVRAIRGAAHVDPYPQEPVRNDAVLSHREQQVLQYVAYGYTHQQVARRLGISPHTVDTYVKRIRAKLSVGNKAELARAAVLGSYMQWPLPQR